MSPSTIPPVGERIREERLRQGMTLRGLARAVGVSPSLISQIETGRSRPSVSTLYAITKALGISIEDVFDAREPIAPPVQQGTGALSMAQALAASAAAVLDQDAVPHLGPLVRPPEREILELDSGVTWERLGRVPGVHVDFLLVTYAPGGTSSSTGQLMRHAGCEYGFLLEGELVLTLGFDDYKVSAGDAVSFPSSTPHRYRNDGERPAVGVWFVYDPHANAI